jgi:hypothetical protein
MEHPAELLPTKVRYEPKNWVKLEVDDQSALDNVALAEGSLIVPLTTGVAQWPSHKARGRAILQESTSSRLASPASRWLRAASTNAVSISGMYL